jgi:hypothetical protein
VAGLRRHPGLLRKFFAPVGLRKIQNELVTNLKTAVEERHVTQEQRATTDFTLGNARDHHKGGQTQSQPIQRIRGGRNPDQAKDIEALGHGAVWVAGSPPDELDWVEPIPENTTLQVTTAGVVNV